jgi:Tfp pilus assembly PilM family ATPase
MSDPETVGRADWLRRTGEAMVRLRTGLPAGLPLVIVLSGRLALVKRIHVPRLGGRRRRRVVQFAVEQSLPLALPDLTWDLLPAGRIDDQDALLVVAAKREVAESLEEAAGRAGFSLRRIVPAAAALLAAAPARREDTEGANLTASLNGLSLTLVYRDSGGVQARQVSLVSAGGADVSREICRALGQFRCRPEMSPLGRIRIAGMSGSALAELAADVGNRFNVSVEPAGGAGAVGAAPAESLLTLAGAAAIHCGVAGRSVDLLPAATRAERARVRRWRLALALVFLSLGAGLVLLASCVRHGAGVRRRAERLDRAVAPLRRVERRMAALEQRRKAAEEARAFLERREGGRLRWAELLADLEQRMRRADGAWIERITVAGAGPDDTLRLAIAGCVLGRRGETGLAADDTGVRCRELLEALRLSPLASATEAETIDLAPDGRGPAHFGLVMTVGGARRG